MGKDFQGSLDVLFNKIEDLVSTKTVVGESINVGDVTIIPLIDVNVGAAVGAKENVNAAGGVGAKILPSALIVIQNGGVKVVNVKNQDAISKIIDMAPDIINKFNFSSIFSNRNKEDEESVEFEEEIIVEEFEAK